MSVIVRILTTAVALAVAAWLLDGISFAGPPEGTAELQEKALPVLVVAAILAVLTAFVKPVLKLLSFPLILLTLGLFLLVINAALLLLTGWLAGEVAPAIGFRVDGFWTALVGSVIITVVTWLLDAVLDQD